ncbi:LytR/AlgR family response regulator transcription factor [Phaeocystidibacter luteus]|uniref:Response regulator transcription factor n=1 Tax=Phaeocystidibacter luteus TaxID=911197 RepID=A0A6N6RJ86_9FLAO|nr:response regulator transcription factor [Phaeocystidibacter luteus]KAB2806820.1 response regulator transcription factor [Phaeocystidibacter luteus]
MATLKCVLVDDEPHARGLLRNLLNQSSWKIDIAGEAADVDTAMELVALEKPDVVFLDIRINERLGFEVLDKFTNRGFKVVFTTAYDHYAVDAFKYGAVHYLLKPYDLPAVEEALARCMAEATNGTNNEEANQTIVSIQSRSETLRIKGSDILYLTGSGSYTEFYLKGGKTVLASKALGHFEKSLPESEFIRIHKKHMVNIRQILSYERGAKSSVEMANSVKLEVGRTYKPKLSSILSS